MTTSPGFVRTEGNCIKRLVGIVHHTLQMLNTEDHPTPQMSQLP